MNAIPADQAAFDVGPKTLEMFARMTKGAKTIFWNGPMGVFETKPFDAGTRGVARLMADSGAFTVVGGGESVEAINEAGSRLEDLPRLHRRRRLPRPRSAARSSRASRRSSSGLPAAPHDTGAARAGPSDGGSR